MAKVVTCGCSATQDAIRHGVTAEEGRCIGCGTPVQRFIIANDFGDFFVKEGGGWTRDKAEAEVFFRQSEAFQVSAERNGRYVVEL